MTVDTIYIISQVVTVIYFGILSFSYLLKDRVKILISNFVAHIGQVTAMALLKGYTGAAMAAIMMVRDLVLLILEKVNIKNKKTVDLWILIVTIILIVALTIFTYNGLLSLLSVVATLITTYALWQKSTKNYKILGIIAGIMWLLYNIFIKSIMGIILESILVICSIIGYIKERKKAND